MPPKYFDAQLYGIASKKAFLTEAQASQLADTLYQEANASHVVITDLQTQSAVTQTNRSTLTVTAIRLQAQGDSYQLVDFVARMKEPSQKGTIVGNLNIAQDKTTAKLTMDMMLYISPIIPGESPVVTQPTPTSAPIVVPPQPSAVAAPQVVPTVVVPQTATPIPSTQVSLAAPTPPTVYIVRAGDTLFSLAIRFGTNVEAIMVVNGLSTFTVRVGQTLRIPNH